MKNKHQKNTDHYSNLITPRKSTQLQFEAMATELDQIAKNKLPDGCLNGLLKGKEADIRQDALILALRWFGRDPSDKSWIPSRSMAYALRYIKMRYARDLAKQQTVSIEYPELLDVIASEAKSEGLVSQSSHAHAMVLSAIKQAIRSGRISSTNATIVLMILNDGQSTSEIAKNLKVTRGAVYQQIKRVRDELPAILDHIEEPNYL
ncbi:MAG: hypothetical protein ACK40T_09165 [Akkermansiaceae bacterium]|jgi:DNA-directed RNA polymerase specialized sigma24 family protein